jgi:cytochrome c oxidase subunit 2
MDYAMSLGDVQQSVSLPAGIQAATIHHLWALMFWTASTVFVIVMVFLLIALRRDGVATRSRELQLSLTAAVGAAVGATVVILSGLLVASFLAERRLDAFQADSAITVDVTGHQWWWEFEYEEAVSDQRVHTANEFHIPLHRPIALKVTSRDVIHSFWLPNLQGKRDLIPGYITAIWIEADRPGIYRGQCAEFCGLQHAHMAFDVVAEPQADFDRWLNAMRQTAQPPAEPTARHGRDVFTAARCAGCHTVHGTDAAGLVGPDLTHIATRSTLGAGTFSNTSDHLETWIRDPQSVKPGNQMPANPLAPSDLQALVAYLETLK